ncbi:asparagine synthase (glutamine-hydrolyzing) [Pelagibacteraceae bacterium]|nr:asparagine synthase (glutamine-hydrolyzing) [Pelagibacteraceae bacterium]
MCGFVGEILFQDNLILNENFLFLKDINKHRGPDDIQYLKLKNFQLIFRRLKIVDLTEKSNQPIVSKCNNYILFFNGEIYNYAEKKKELLDHGFEFFSDGDGEVILNLFLKYGKNFVDHLQGMFAIGIWDRKKKELYVARDHFGQKPFFYVNYGNRILFASEIKDLLELDKSLKSENFNVVKKYLISNSLDTDTNTFFKKIKRIQKSCLYKFNKTGIHKSKYWSLKLNNEKKLDINELKEFFWNSTSLYMKSDVKTCFALSGGLDSGFLFSISNLLGNNYKGYSLAVEKTESESKTVCEYKKKFNSDISTLNISNINYSKIFNEVLNSQTEPFHGISAIYQFLLRKKAKRDGYKVIITGDGADEIFGGYKRHYYYYLYNLKINKEYEFLNSHIKTLKSYQKKIITKNFKIIENTINNKTNDINDKIYKNYLNKDLLKDELKFNWTPLNKKIKKNFFKHTLERSLNYNDLESILRTDDLNSMSFSIENRAPFLNHKLIEKVFNLNYKCFGLEKKYKNLLFNMSNKIVPNKVYNSKTKYQRPGRDNYITCKYFKNEFLDLIASDNSQIFKINKIKNYLKNNNSMMQNTQFFFRCFNILKWKNNFL